MLPPIIQTLLINTLRAHPPLLLSECAPCIEIDSPFASVSFEIEGKPLFLFAFTNACILLDYEIQGSELRCLDREDAVDFGEQRLISRRISKMINIVI